MLENQDPAQEVESAPAPSLVVAPIEATIEQPVTAEQPAPEAREPHWYRQDIKRREKEAKDLRRELDQLKSQFEPQQQYIHPEDQGYDPYTYTNEALQQAKFELRVERSEEKLRDKHGDDVFEDVDLWLRSRPDLIQAFQAKRDPYAEAYKHFQQERVAAEIGNDPAAYRERLRAELMAEMNTSQGGQVPTQARTLLPPNASAQRSAGFVQRGKAGPTPLSQILPS
jgi:hypothetical protein